VAACSCCGCCGRSLYHQLEAKSIKAHPPSPPSPCCGTREARALAEVGRKEGRIYQETVKVPFLPSGIDLTKRIDRWMGKKPSRTSNWTDWNGVETAAVRWGVGEGERRWRRGRRRGRSWASASAAALGPEVGRGRD
jgi:hypothetical protein